MKSKAICAVGICMLILLGCGVKPRPAEMIPRTAEFNFVNSNKSLKLNHSVGGKESDPLIEGSKIDNQSFTTALMQSLTNSNLFSEVSLDKNSDYELTPLVMNQDQPFLGINMTVSLRIRYVLTSGIDKAEIWKKDINSTYTATMGDAFVGSTRLKKANEGAVRENIKMLLQEISNLKL
jgi:hypothetical protein